MNPKFVETYIVHEKNCKDEILIRHLIQVTPWKARHGQVKSAWEKVINGILLEKWEGSCIKYGIQLCQMLGLFKYGMATLYKASENVCIIADRCDFHIPKIFSMSS